MFHKKRTWALRLLNLLNPINSVRLLLLLLKLIEFCELFFKKTSSCRDGVVLSKLLSLVRPHLEYCIQACNPYLQRDIDTLEKVQRWATKMVSGLGKVPYEEWLKRLNFIKLKTKRIRCDLI